MMISRRSLIDLCIDLCTLHLEWNHKVYSVPNFLDECLAEISREPNFRAFCEWKKPHKIRGMAETEKWKNAEKQMQRVVKSINTHALSLWWWPVEPEWRDHWALPCCGLAHGTAACLPWWDLWRSMTSSQSDPEWLVSIHPLRPENTQQIKMTRFTWLQMTQWKLKIQIDVHLSLCFASILSDVCCVCGGETAVHNSE